MARRLLVDIDNKIIRAIIHVGADEGVQKVSAQKVAKLCDISHYTCFMHFGTIRGMLDAAADYLSAIYSDAVRQWMDTDMDAGQVWDAMLDKLVEYPEGALYYFDYLSRFGLTEEAVAARREDYIRYARRFLVGTAECTDDECVILWDYFATAAFSYAERFIRGIMADTPETRAMIRRMVIQGTELE